MTEYMIFHEKKNLFTFLGARLEKEEEEKEMANVAAEWIVIGHRLGKLVLEGSTRHVRRFSFFWGCRHLLHHPL
jgi:hypothetical protein